MLDAGMNKILSAQSVNGSLVNRVETTLERNEMRQVEVTRLQSSYEDADLAKVITDYSVLYTVFQAALASTARIMQTSLADYLR
jgi:flagellar hook-associated protein 3 FlgL